jgi:hypothetical protein
MIFDFKRPGFSTVRLRQYENGGNTSLALTGTAYGAEYDSGVTGGYSSLYAGTHNLLFTCMDT